MIVSKRGLDIIKKWEGYRGNAYYCPSGVLTVGYGHTNRAGTLKISESTYFSEEKAEEVLVLDLKKFTAYVDKYVTRSMTQGQYDAFTSLVYNLGPGSFKSSTFLKRFNAGESNERVCQAIGWWNKGTVKGKKVVLKGLVNRREDEVKLFKLNYAASPSPISEEVTSTGAGTPKTKVSFLSKLLNLLFNKGK